MKKILKKYYHVDASYSLILGFKKISKKIEHFTPQEEEGARIMLL